MFGFNIRVYGIYINENRQILLSDEKIGNYFFTKFPGGGLEFGEGIIDCLKREWLEELNIEIDTIEHFYTTDFFQESLFKKNEQIISIYYLVTPKQLIDAVVSPNFSILNTDNYKNEAIRFMAIKDLDTKHFALPIDKIVVDKLIQQEINYTLNKK